MARRIPSALLLVLSLLPFLSCNAQVRPVENQCVYTIYVRTGTQPDAGTDSTISLEFGDPIGNTLRIRDLRSWGGLMGLLHNYFQRGNLDIFAARGPCLVQSICRVRVNSNGFGLSPNWFLDQIEVFMAGPSLDRCLRSQIIVRRYITRQSGFELDSCRRVAENETDGGCENNYFMVDGESVAAGEGGSSVA